MPLPPKKLASPRNGFARFRGAKCLRERCLVIAEPALVVELRKPEHQTLARSYVPEHLRKKVLYQLERSNWLSKLRSLLGVFQRCLEGAHLDAGGSPTHHVARHSQHPRCVAERVTALQAIRLRHPHIRQGDLSVLNNFQRDLVFHLLDAESGRDLIFNDEALDLIVIQIPCPDDRNVAPWRVTDPPLLAVENPGISFAFGGRGQAAA